MADRYLVAGAGGTKNWSDTSIWSATSGGSTGETAPTLNDAVIMDAASLSGSLILTLDANSACASLDSSGLDNICTITGSVYTLSLYGSLTEHATNSRYNLTGTSYLYFRGTGTITTNGNNFHTWNRWYIDGAGITVTNGDNANIGATGVYLTNGTLNTNDQTLTSTGALSIPTGTRTLTTGSSSIYFRQFAPSSSEMTGFTLNSGTSTIYITSGEADIRGLNWYNLVLNVNSTSFIIGSPTFNNLTILSTTVFTFYSATTVSGTLTITGANATSQRVLIQSNTIGTARTITCNGTTNITNADFQDITLAGTANRDFSAQTDIGDCGGNSGITFPPAIDCYRVGVGNVSDATKWRTTDGGAIQARVPLPQDRAWLTAQSFTGASTMTMDCPRIGSIDMSGVNQAVTWAQGNAMSCFGNYVLGTNVTPSMVVAQNITLCGRSDYNFNIYGKTIYVLIIEAYGGIYRSLSGFTYTGLFRHNLGTLYLSSYVYKFETSSLLTLQVFLVGATTTIYSETSTLLFNYLSGSLNPIFSGGGKAYNIVQFSGNHTGNFDITGSNTFAQLIIDPGRKVRFTAGTTQTIATTGKLTATGTPSSKITLTTISGTATIAYAGTGYHQCNDVDASNLIFTANRFYIGRRSTQTNCTNLKTQYTKTPQTVTF